MWIDLSLGSLIILCGVFGLFMGIVSQLFRLGGLVLVVLYARAVAEPIGQWLAERFSLMPLLAYYISLIVGGLIIYALCALAGRTVHKMLKSSGGLAHGANRFLGGILGLAHGLVIAFLLTCILNIVPAEAMNDYPRLQAQHESSRAVPLVNNVNPLPQLGFLAYAEDYKAILADKEAQKILQRQDAFVRLQGHPKFRSAVEDEELIELIEEKRWVEVLVHRRVLALFFDREVREILNELGPGARAALERAEKMRKDSKKQKKTPGPADLPGK